jgi:hypothetical protein
VHQIVGISLATDKSDGSVLETASREHSRTRLGCSVS